MQINNIRPGVISLLLNYLGYKEKICPFFILQKRIRMQFYFFLYIFIFKYILKAIEIIFLILNANIYFFLKNTKYPNFSKTSLFLVLQLPKSLKKILGLIKNRSLFISLSCHLQFSDIFL
jgi:hypothetical protein